MWVLSRPLGHAFDARHPPPHAEADKCVHCGFCLPSCPTYLLWGEEMDSPRGRIYLMKAALDSRVDMTDRFVGHFDACLGCMACVTACPSGVQYGPLIEATRAQIERRYERPASERRFRRLLFAILPRPGRLRAAALAAAAAGPAIRWLEGSDFLNHLPRHVQALVRLAPRASLRSALKTLPALTPASGKTRRRVGLLTGCVQRAFFHEVNAATARVLAAEGCDVVAPVGQGCCGALALHAGYDEMARTLARGLIAAFEKAKVDVIAVNVAGCGSAMKEYGSLLAGDPVWAARARDFAARVRDVSEVLDEVGDRLAPRHPLPARVAYHDACHLAHAQGVRRQPRDMLAAIPGLTILAFPEGEICCGSAGIYNLVQPETAAALGDRKVRHIATAKPDAVVTGNAGCLLQIASSARRHGQDWPVLHPIQLVDASIRKVSFAALLGREPPQAPSAGPTR
jgi:glycolate oxidase iron-sulfur subunit